MAEDGMVRATSEDPRFGSSWQIRLRFPQRIRHRQFRQGVRGFHRVDTVNQQTVTIAEINQAGNNRWTGLGIEDQAGRIVLTTNTEMLNVEDRFLFYCNRRADFQHMGAEHQVIAFLEVIGVVLHKGGTALQTG